MDIDAAGGAVTGGLIAGAIEKRTGKAGHARTTCSDCGAPVAANFCAECGQPTHVHRSLLHLGEELLHGVVHFDGRIWRTLPLLVLNPGKLTREWIAGRRTRYVSPLALFLFSVFVMFFALSFLPNSGLIKTESVADRITSQQEDVEAARKALADFERGVRDGAGGAGPKVKVGAEEGSRFGVTVAENDDAPQSLAEAKADLERAEEKLAELKTIQAAGADSIRADGYKAGSWQAELRDSVKAGRVKVAVGDAKMKERVLHKLENPDLLVYKLQQAFYKYAFLLVPLSIPAVALLFLWKRGFTWYDHGVFVLYSLSFFAASVILITLADRLWEPLASGLAIAFTIGLPVHMFAQLKGAYGLSAFSAVWRTWTLLWLCLFVAIAFSLIVILLGLTG